MPQLTLRPFWQSYFGNVLFVALLFGVIFIVIRGFGVLGPAALRPVLPLGFTLMTLMPFIFLNKNGRQQIGFQASKNWKYYAVAILLGAVAATICYFLGLWLFGMTKENWYISIRDSYLDNIALNGIQMKQAFWIITLPALIFSPLGEEIYFRGFLQESLATKLSYRNSMILESLFFGLIHLFHHGIIHQNGNYDMLPVSGALWVVLMSGTAFSFAWLRKTSGSLYPAIMAHVAFNFVMNTWIFKFLL